MRLLSFVFALVLFVPLTTSAQWQPVQSNTNAEFRGLSAVNANVVWASGTRGRVAHSVDGGITWRIDTIAGAESLDLRSIYARSPTLVWAASAGPAEQGHVNIFGARDGRTWSKQFTTRDSGLFLDAIAFWDDAHGIAFSDPIDGRLYLLVTDDAGKTWTRLDTKNAPPLLPGEAVFAASGTGLIVQGASNVWIGTGGGARARVFHSTDRGKTWSVADTPLFAGNSAAGIFSVALGDAQHGVVVGGQYDKPKEHFDNVAVTSDGGRTWRLAKGPLPAGFMSCVAFVPGTGGRSLVAVGLAGTATSNDGGESWTMIDSVAYNSVAFASQTAGWAVGPRGRIARWTRRQ